MPVSRAAQRGLRRLLDHVEPAIWLRIMYGDKEHIYEYQ